jgi:hypothetical protein
VPHTLDFEEVLSRCGVGPGTLGPDERDALDRDGWVLLPGVIEARALERMRADFDAAAPAKSDAETGTRHPDVLASAARTFASLWTGERVLAAVQHVLGRPFRVGQLSGREPQRGCGRQGLHADWVTRAEGEPYRVVTVFWMLDAFESDNGATRLVPGTHRFPKGVPRSLADPARRHPDERTVTASAGTALVFNGHLWHSGTENRSGARRRSIQASFVARGELGMYGRPVEASAELEPVARWLLGV